MIELIKTRVASLKKNFDITENKIALIKQQIVNLEADLKVEEITLNQIRGAHQALSDLLKTEKQGPQV